MLKILLDAFGSKPIIYEVQKKDLEAYLRAQGIDLEKATDLQIKDWIYNNQDTVKKLAKKRTKVHYVC